ncbi:MAG TPA: hypothetical protein VGL72_26375 [Bryobacteraceae bacterium]|jgi:hypothetical protein
MATTITTPQQGYSETDKGYLVVHPLDDIPEAKIDTDNLGPMPMTRSVKLSLLSLRAYLMLMILMVLYHVLQIGGLFH